MNGKEFEKELFGNIQNSIYKYCIYVGMKYERQEDIEDIVQDTLLKAWRGFNNNLFDGRIKLKTWVYIILKRRIIDYYRSKRVKKNITDINYEFVVYDKYSDYLLYNNLMKRINTLSKTYRFPFILFYIHGFSYKECAEILKTKLPQIKGRLYKAREILIKDLDINYIYN